MFNKRFEDITLGDIQRLVNNKITENVHLDYKEKLSFRASGKVDDTVKAEFVKDISAFANAGGGLLIYGVSENNHLPDSVKGVEIDDEDALRRRIIEIVNKNTDPSFTDIKMRSIPFVSGKVIFLIRIEKNLLTLPRRNTLDNNFWVRTDNKASCMDTATIIGYANIRQHTEDIIQKIIGYKKDRLNEIIANNNNRISADRSYVIMQFVPEDFDSFHCDIKTIRANTLDRREDIICPFNGGNMNIEADGYLMFNAPNDRFSTVDCTEYLKFYKNGIVEWASDWFIYNSQIDWKHMVKCIFSLTKKLLVYYESIGLNSPLHVGITLTNVQGCFISINNYRDSKALESNMIHSMDICLQKHCDFNAFTYKRFLDDFFNALGLSGCPIYKDEQTLDSEFLNQSRITL